MRSWIAVAAGIAVLLTALPVRGEEACSTCHPNVKTEYGDSIHAEELGCSTCHGGDPTSETVEAAHDPAKGYMGKRSRQDIPALCATCHADPNRMKPFGLPTDQYAQYVTSGHGVRLAQGDTRVAVCTDCHGTHRILRSQEPTSPTARRNIPATCGSCHSDAKRMSAYNMATDQEAKFRQSVHGIALFGAEHPSAPTCATCHGAHGAMAPQIGSIQAVCGHCHVRTREYFNASPHRAAAVAGKMSECASCHGYHDVASPDRTLFDTTCPVCHAAESPPFNAAQNLKTLLIQTEEAVATAAAEIDEAAKHAPTTTRYRARLQQSWAYFTEALPLQHSLDVERVRDLARTSRSISLEVRGAVHGVQEESRLRYVLLALIWVAVVVSTVISYAYRRSLQARVLPHDRNSDSAARGREI